MSIYGNVNQLGSGGFGEVWVCERDEDSQRFAKKILQAGVDEEGKKRFAREVRILGSLDHPNVVKVVAVRLQEEPLWYVMPLYRQSLEQELPALVKDAKRIKVIFDRIFDGIEYAHKQGVIHRDLKPANVLMNDDTDVVLSDFGLGRQFDAVTSRKTLTGAGLGTPLYMAPEQINDAKNADERADVYSLGRMLYEVYTGALGFGTQDMTTVPPHIRPIIDRCTRTDPSRRFQSVSELKQAWKSVHEAVGQASDASELQSLVAYLSSGASVVAGTVKKLLDGLSAHLEDEDLIHNSVMSVSLEVFGVMYKENPEGLKALIHQFSEVTARKGWGFDYTDKIGRRCRDIFYSVEDADVRADAVWCAAVTGTDHNRYYVMELAGDLIQTMKTQAEAEALAARLWTLDVYVRQQLVRYINVWKLDALIKPIFVFSETK
jgi:serine/threonine protein kinase